MEGSPFELPDHRVDFVLNHSDIVPFVRSYFRKRNPVMFGYWTFTIILVTILIFALFAVDGSIRQLDFFFLGFAFFFLLIPVHEFIHGIGYRLAGAPKVSYRANWRKLVFYAVADRFFTSRVPFVLLASAPFVLINSMLILIIIAKADSPFSWMAGGALLMHTGGCAGDFAMISYLYEKWKFKPVVCDDVAKGQTWFFINNLPEG